MEKECIICKEVKPFTEFYKRPAMRDGMYNECKACICARRRVNYRENTDREREYGKMRKQLPEVKEMRRRLSIKYYHQYPEKTLARRMTGNAIAGGKLERQPCGVCGKENAQAHHEDYSKPFDIMWLCFKHHREHHGETVYEGA